MNMGRDNNSKKHVFFADEAPGHVLVQTRVYDPCAPIMKRKRRRLPCAAWQPLAVCVEPVDGPLPTVTDVLRGASPVSLLSVAPSADGQQWVAAVCTLQPPHCSSHVWAEYSMEGGMAAGCVDALPVSDCGLVDGSGGQCVHMVSFPRLAGRSEGTMRLTVVQELTEGGSGLRSRVWELRWHPVAGYDGL
eukprot:comp23116_c0_seq1/m.37226 comp23116_c0_seq1/g.37226  ORF comp23116_c0_seq1/g.37226 comp23116_c0_seq1/m.37226 type:complete len:190 (-) comp23116_c0_seq1:494-1063(-)